MEPKIKRKFRAFAPSLGTSEPTSAAISQGRVYPMPDECYSVGAVKLVVDHAAGTAVSCIAMLKG